MQKKVIITAVLAGSGVFKRQTRLGILGIRFQRSERNGYG